MNLLVFGATGKTGRLVVERALAKGHTVTALVRDPIKLTHPGVRVFPGNATNPSDVRAAMRGRDSLLVLLDLALPRDVEQGVAAV